MKTAFISKEGSGRLILLFAGWGMDAHPFMELHRSGYDIAVVWDYRNRDFDTSIIDPYCEVCVVAWSLGVSASACVLSGIEHKVTRYLAVNGTLNPIDDLEGIPRAIYMGTYEGLDERSLQKFNRRMAGSPKAFADFCARAPQRTVDELREELYAFVDRTLSGASRRPDVAIIGLKDAIFPPANQLRAWKNTPVEQTDEPHLPDFQRILDTYIIDKDHVGRRFGHRRMSYDASAEVQQRIVERLTGLIEKHCTVARIHDALEVGSGTGLLSKRLDAILPPDARLCTWDIAGDAPLSGPNRSFSRCDAEVAIHNMPSESIDLVCSASTVQWFNSPAAFFKECHRVLRPGGLLAIATFLRGNLPEVEQSTGLSLPLFTEEEWLGALPAGFRELTHEASSDTLLFDSPADAFRHLSLTGVNSLSTPDGASTLRKAIKNYPLSSSGHAPLTYKSLIFLFIKE